MATDVEKENEKKTEKNSSKAHQRKGAQAIAQQIKFHLKSRQMDYKSLSEIWKISESSVKRVMSKYDFTIERIENFCEAIELDIGEFFKTTNFESQTQVYYLTDEQEQKLSKDRELTHVYMLIEEGFTAQDILKTHVISHEKLTKLLLQLNRVGLIELNAHNKFQRVYTGQMRFKKDGPLAKILLQEMRDGFLQSNFNRDDQYLTFVMVNFIPGMLAQFKVRFQNLIKDLIVSSEQNRNHPNKEEYGLLIATRGWPSPMNTAITKRKQTKS